MEPQPKRRFFVPPPAAIWVGLLFVAFPLVVFLLFWLLNQVRQPAASAPSPPPSVLVILLDTVRADRFGCYGYDKPTTPNMDRLAAEATVFEYVISTSPWTIPSHASIFTGLFPSAHGADRNNKWLADHLVTLAETLRSHGYDTYLFSANPFVSKQTNFTQGFEAAEFPWDAQWKDAVEADIQSRTPGPAQRGGEEGTGREFKDAGAVTNRAFLEWLDHHDSGKPFFAFLNYMECHAPLAPSLAERQRFLDPATARRSFELPQSFVTRWAHSFQVRPYSEEAIRVYNALYDAALYRLDTLVGQLVSSLSQRGLLDRTVVVVTSDHGENLNEHHLLGHEYCVYNTLLRVPLLIHYPARFPARRVTHPVQTIDLYPTILELAAAHPPTPERVQGISLLAQLRSPPDDRPLVSEYLDPPELGVNLVSAQFPDRFPSSEHARWLRKLRSIESDGYKYIRAEDGHDELYRLADDPGELDNRIGQERARAEDLGSRLDAWLDSFVPAAPPPQSPTAPAGLPPDVLERLGSLGYVQPGSPTPSQPAEP